MSSEEDPRLALTELMAAFQAHFDVASRTTNPEDPELLEAEEELRDAFFTYDNALFTAFEAELPFDLIDDEAMEDEDLDEEDLEDDEDLDDELDDDEEYEDFDLDEDEDLEDFEL